ncbi:CusA/CzcA family heavy metal efflux RND transporter [Marinigracilibium pacificum]|uniref:CusA/CzcA family heavy metal efflux RND transporter n=1 Tax=Marinigracilibium pacificum TaxID=2729599 RepID=A0A848J2F0_9BACT|nr:CusA/CzcA family heavy metal efflux RND transporter [Marinigracilibium pacificum]NMM49956.1 CusA/CzcA family heavy metal efflux RND transporter [Marinigracilibium pacificum]
MINKIIEFSIHNKLVIGLLTTGMIIAGLWSLTKVPLDAVPDITNNQVQIITQAPNLGTEDIEQFITYPIEIEMANLPGVLEIRSISRFGLSLVTLVFEDDMETYLPRQLVSEKLIAVSKEIPEGFGKPDIGPISTGLSEIYQYTLSVDPKFKDKYSITELRTIQDWIIKRQMAMVPGVVEVNAFGGKIKQYEVSVDPEELKSIGLTITDIFTALEENNQNTGGAYIEKDHQANFIRGEGLARSLSDIENIVIKNIGGIPITIKDIAQVKFGHAIRYGALTKNGNGETVGGMILMLKGANSNKVIEAVKDRMDEIQRSLPEGITIEPFLDRSELISNTTSTISRNLIEGALIVIFILVLLLGNWRGGLIVASTIPLSLLFAFILMNVFDVWANLMSLGAIDFGIIVDGAVIIVEGTVFLLHQKILNKNTLNKEERNKTAYEASSKMMNAAFFGQLIILIVFIPILALEGVEGKMFQPMALTFMFAMIGVMLLCLTYVPMMSSLFLRVKQNEKPSFGDKIVTFLEKKYEQALTKALKIPGFIIGVAISLLVISVLLFSRMGGEFIPQLDEGDIAFHIILKPGSSLTESVKASTKVEKILLDNFPEIEQVISRFGVADVPTDPMPMDIADCFIILKPKDEWVSAKSKEDLINKIKEKIEIIPGLTYEFTQPIEMRFNELITGVREDIAVKLYGEDLELLASKAEEMGKIISSIDGVGDMRVEATSGLPQITINYNRSKLAQYGINIDEVNTTIQTAFAGREAGVIFEGEKRFDLVVRLNEKNRQNIDDIKNLYINLPNGSQIPLKEVTTISYQPGPMQISRDNTNRRVYVGINVRGRDIKSLVEEIKATLNDRLDLPPGYYIRYGGAFENFDRAFKRLKLVVPIALILIFILIFFALNSMKQTFMIYGAIPMAAIGGILALWLRDMPFSISAGVGFVVLFGVAVLNGLVLISSWNEIKTSESFNLTERIMVGTKRRIRPILLTALTDILGFLPMAISKGSGAEVQRPLATVVIGGMISATLLTLFVLPILYQWLEKKYSFNKKTTLLSIAVIMLFINPLTIKAQDSDSLYQISLDSAINRAIQLYPEIKSSRMEIDKQESLKKTAWELGNTQFYTAGEEIGNNQDGVTTVFGIQQQNINIFGVPSKSKLQTKQINFAEAALELSSRQIELEVKQQYIRLFRSIKVLNLYNSLDSVFNEFERAAKIRYETEESSRLEYLAAVNQAKQIKIQKDQRLYDLMIELSKFNLWMVSDTIFTVQTQIIEQSNDILTGQVIPNDHPILNLARKENEVAEQQVNTLRADLLPKLNVQYGWQEINNQSGFYQYQFGLSIPLFFMQNSGKIQAAKISQLQTEQNLVQKEMELTTTLSASYNEFLKWKRSWEYYNDEALELAEEQFNGAVLSYREGAIDYVAFLQNIQSAISIEIDAWNAYEMYMTSKFKVEYLLNK